MNQLFIGSNDTKTNVNFVQSQSSQTRSDMHIVPQLKISQIVLIKSSNWLFQLNDDANIIVKVDV